MPEIYPFPIMTCDEGGDVVYMNPACRQLLADTGIPVDEYARILPERYKALIARALRDSAPPELDLRREGRFLRFVFRASPDRQNVFVFIMDMTEEEEAKAQLLQSEKMASLGLLIAGLAHEINTPLGAIHSNNDIVGRSLEKLNKCLDQADPPASNADDVARILSVLDEVCKNSALATERLIGIVGSLKNFARVDESDRKQVNIHEGIDSTLVLVQHQFKGRIKVVKEYGDIPLVECYPNRLNQVFMNMLVNAGQAISDRGTVTIRTYLEDDFVKIAISDTGVGIRPESLSKIFDPGFTTKGVGVGTGLGLSICYRIIQEHKGSIDVASDNTGSTFTIKLPLHQGGEVTTNG
jgi:signal transduction histidine kinase